MDPVRFVLSLLSDPRFMHLSLGIRIGGSTAPRLCLLRRELPVSEMYLTHWHSQDTLPIDSLM